MTGPIVINLGLPKSGTSTLAKALRRASFRVADWRIRPQQTEDESLHGQFVGALLYDGYYNSGDPLARLKGFTAISEMSAAGTARNYWPQTDWGLISAIAKKHPEALFLLSARDPVKTADSMIRWNSLGKTRLPRMAVPGLPKGYGRGPEDLTRWIEGHHDFCRRVFAGSDRFFEFDVADPDAQDKISGFLGVPMPWWGIANRNYNNPPVKDDNVNEAS